MIVRDSIPDGVTNAHMLAHVPGRLSLLDRCLKKPAYDASLISLASRITSRGMIGLSISNKKNVRVAM